MKANELNNRREIQAYSNSMQLDYKKKNWFHYWVDINVALCETEDGEMVYVHPDQFKFVSTGEELTVKQ